MREEVGQGSKEVREEMRTQMANAVGELHKRVDELLPRMERGLQDLQEETRGEYKEETPFLPCACVPVNTPNQRFLPDGACIPSYCSSDTCCSLWRQQKQDEIGVGDAAAFWCFGRSDRSMITY